MVSEQKRKADPSIFIFRSAQGGCKTYVSRKLEGEIIRLAREDMNPVTGWVEEQWYWRPTFTGN